MPAVTLVRQQGLPVAPNHCALAAHHNLWLVLRRIAGAFWSTDVPALRSRPCLALLFLPCLSAGAPVGPLLPPLTLKHPLRPARPWRGVPTAR